MSLKVDTDQKTIPYDITIGDSHTHGEIESDKLRRVARHLSVFFESSPTQHSTRESRSKRAADRREQERSAILGIIGRRKVSRDEIATGLGVPADDRTLINRLGAYVRTNLLEKTHDEKYKKARR